ncbi:hypothetical protein CWB41_04560 [Methylovirgula ligni]|nr:hypothetical protein CWB41_04560 [Methylovirgula ligni]
MHADEADEAYALLLMITEKIHAAPIVTESGRVQVVIDLEDREFDWLCEWGTGTEDDEQHDPSEDDDPREEDMPPEHSENLETDSRFRFGPGETTGVANLFERGRRVIVGLGETEVVGTVKSCKLGADWPRYTIEIAEPPGVLIEADSCHVYPSLEGV